VNLQVLSLSYGFMHCELTGIHNFNHYFAKTLHISTRLVQEEITS